MSYLLWPSSSPLLFSFLLFIIAITIPPPPPSSSSVSILLLILFLVNFSCGFVSHHPPQRVTNHYLSIVLPSRNSFTGQIVEKPCDALYPSFTVVSQLNSVSPKDAQGALRRTSNQSLALSGPDQFLYTGLV